MRTRFMIVGLALLGATTLAAQVPTQPPGKEQQQQIQQQQQQQLQLQVQAQNQERIRALQQQVDGLMLKLRETNRYMAQQRTHQQYEELGRQMEQATERVRDMLRQMDQINKDGTLLADQDRLRDFDRLRDRLHDMTRDMDQAHDALRQMIHKP